MNSREAERLLAGAVPRRPGVWADLGAGDGTFARALARLTGRGSRIYAVDRDPHAIAALTRSAAADGEELAVALGLSKPRVTATRPSAYGGIIYVARLSYSADGKR